MGEVEFEFLQEAGDKSEYAFKVALEEAATMQTPELQTAYAEAIALVEYYSTLERKTSSNPRLHFDAIRRCLKEMKAETILRQAEDAEDQGIELSRNCMVPTRPLLDLIRRLMVLMPTRSQQ